MTILEPFGMDVKGMSVVKKLKNRRGLVEKEESHETI